MAPIYSGSLQPKKKAELQGIASALRLSDQGTKEELQGRIKKHLDNNQATLEDDPVFGGLFGRRKRSVQPHFPPTRFAAPESSPDSTATRASRRVIALDPVRESTPNGDVALKSPPSDLGTPSSLPALPESPNMSFLEVSRREVEVVLDIVKRKEEIAVKSAGQMAMNVRTFLSNSRNIWSLTALCELVYILYTVVQWQIYPLPLSPSPSKSFPSLPLIYPPLNTFHKTDLGAILIHWAIPTLIFPALFGTIISFRPSSSSQQLPFDPLTASIVRLAAHVAYPYSSCIANKSKASDIDVMGSNARLVSAGVAVAFAFAEAIAGAPAAFAEARGDQGTGMELTDFTGGEDILEEIDE